MRKKIHSILSLAIILFAHPQLSGQAFLNGSFEINTAAACDYNMANATWNALMANSTAYGGGGELDIMQSGCPYGPSQAGTWFVALAFPSTSDAFTMQLSAPLVAGTTYSMSFWDKGDVVCCAPGMPVRIGLSTVAGAAGTTIYTGPTPTGGTWNQRCFTFVAPNNGQHVSVTTTGPTRWSHVDNFVLNGSCVVLPIELECFTSECSNGTTALKWTTALEKNNDYFTVQFSNDGINFSDIGTVKAAGNSNNNKYYQFNDSRSHSDYVYYRLKQTDFSKEASFTPIIGAEKCKTIFDFSFEVYPNPASENILIKTDVSGVEVIILNSLGQLVYSGISAGSETVIDISQLGKGLYFVQVITEGKSQTKKVIKE